MLKKIVGGFIGFIFSTTLIAQPGIQVPYCDNFDGPNIWTADSISGIPWQLGVPDTANGFPSTVHSGPNVWGIGLSATYYNNAATNLISPKFDFSGTGNLKLSFWINSFTELGWDGVRLEYSTDSIIWNILGSVGDTAAENWYSNPAINCESYPGWDGNSSFITGNLNGWIKAEYELVNAGLNNVPEVWFRFHFCSDGVINEKGFAVDDFCIMKRPDIDAGISGVNAIYVQTIGTCNNLDVILENSGNLSLLQTPIYYSVNSGTPVLYNWNGNLAPGASTTVALGCFTVPAGLYTLCAWTQTIGDSISSNDSSCVSLIGLTFFNSNVCHDFEIDNGEFFSDGSGVHEWEHGAPAYGLTTGAHSGVNAWDILLNLPYTPSISDTLYSSVYSVDTLLNPTLTFWHNRNTVDGIDGYWIEYREYNDSNWTQLGMFADSNAINWYSANFINASGYAAWEGTSTGWEKSLFFLRSLPGIDSLIQFRIIFSSTNSSSIGFAGVSIDDFCVYHPDPVDASLESLTSSFGGLFQQQGYLDTVVVRIRNFGSADLTSADFYYSIDGGPAFGPFAWTGLVAPSQFSGDIYLTTIPFIVPFGSFEICAWIDAVNDSDFSNDTSCASFYGMGILPLTFSNPYCNDFESTLVDWATINMATSQNTLWELGTPAFGLTTGAFSGTKCWDINLTTAYNNEALTALYTPVFQIPSNGNPVLSFYQNRNTEQNWDGMRLEYSINGGSTWVVLGNSNLPSSVATNWYNMNFVNCSNLPAWAGNSLGWIQSTYRDLSYLNGTVVQFRFIFCSDLSVVVDGISIDNFCLNLSAPVSVAPETAVIVNPISLNFPGQCYSFTTNYINTGVNDLNVINTSLLIDGLQVSSGTVTFSPPLTTATVSNDFTFPNCWTATPGTHSVCVITSNPNGGMDYNMNDDALCFTITVLGQQDLTTGNSYCEDFESTQAFLAVNGLTYSNISSWKYGLPSKTFLNDANSGNKAWVTNLTQMYPANDNSALLTQMFTLNTNTAYALRFYTKFKTEYMNDGGTLQYSTDFANSWTSLGDNNSPQWMNTPNIIAINPNPPPNMSGWSGTSAWQQMQHPVCFPSTQGTVPVNVLFRFLFKSDVFTQDEGWEIDDFCIVPDTGICTVGLNENALQAEAFAAGVYPNPAKEKLILSFYIPKDGMVDFVISDITGKSLIVSENVRYQNGLHQIDLSSYEFAPGSYFYSVMWDNQIKNGKLVIIGN